MNETVKRYAISTFITFLTGFCIVFVTQVDQLTTESITDGTILGLLFAGARAGVKAVIEAYLAYQTSRQ